MYVHVCLHVCTQKIEIDSPFHLWPISYIPPVSGNFLVALNSCTEFIFYGFLSPLPPIFILMISQIKQSATNQAMKKLGKSNHMEQIEQCV